MHKQLLLLVFLLVAGCAPRTVFTPPKNTFVDPVSFQSGADVTEYRKGYLAYESGDQRKARVEFNDLLKENPQHYPAILGIAYTYMAEGNTDFAERYIRKSLEIEANYAQAHFLLAYILEQRHEYEAAIQELNQVQAVRPEYPGLEQSRNILRIKATEIYLDEARKLAPTEPDAALQRYSTVLQMAPDLTQIPLEMAQVLLSHHRCAEAIPYLREALEETPADAEIRLQIADCHYELDQLDEAFELYTALLQDMPTQEIRSRVEQIQRTRAFQKMPEEYQAIQKTEQINRGQLAALLLTELRFLQQYKPASSEIMVDILNHWAKNYIQKAVDLGILEVFPNRTFEPHRSVSRLELARAATRMIQLLETAGRRTPALESTYIPDVPMTNVHYPLVSTALAAGVLSLDGDGKFHSGRAVSGAEALSMVNRMKTLSE